MKKIILIGFVTIIVLFLLLFLLTGGVRTDVYLKEFWLDNNGKTLTIDVGVSSSTGYIRKIKIKQVQNKKYVTFYSTFGVNSKIGSHDIFKIDLEESTDEIYFYGVNYNKVLEKSINNEWQKVTSVTNKVKEIVDNSKKIENFSCDTALEQFYEDELYNYNYECIKSSYVVVLYEDGHIETVKDALNHGKITITDLDDYNIHYIKRKKENVSLKSLTKDGLIFSIISGKKIDCVPVKLSVYENGKYVLYTHHQSNKPNDSINSMLIYTKSSEGNYNYDIAKIINNSVNANEKSYAMDDLPQYEIFTGIGLMYTVENGQKNQYLDEFLNSINIDLNTCSIPN